MANIFDQLAGVLDSQTLKDFISGKAKPEVTVNTNVALDEPTVKLMGKYIFLAFTASFFLMAMFFYWVLRWSIIAAYRRR